MRLDEQLKKARKTPPPDTLRKRVMDAINEEPQKSLPVASARNAWLYGLAAAAALVIAVRVSAPPPPAHSPSPPVVFATLAMVTESAAPDNDLTEFLERALDDLYDSGDYDQTDGNGNEAGDIDTFINDEIKTIFWMDEGAENV